MMNSSTMNFPALKFSTPKPKGTFQSNTFQQWTNVQKIIVEKFMFEKSRVEKFLFAFGLKSSGLKSPGLKSSWLKFMWLKTSRSKCPSTTTWPQSKTSHLKKEISFVVFSLPHSTKYLLHLKEKIWLKISYWGFPLLARKYSNNSTIKIWQNAKKFATHGVTSLTTKH